ncbi:MAG: domain S-box protein [Actinomycetia bacterium]|nr:domain S-box protein [Actinomycetes bacterium]
MRSLSTVRFSTQVLLLQLGILGLVCAAGFALMALLVRHDLVEQYQERALAIARSVAADPQVAEAIVAEDRSGAVQARAEAVRRRTGARFVVVTDAAGIRYSHPDATLVGHPVAADQAQALDGHEVKTFGTSAVGVAARGKVPLRDTSGNVVGEVIVGILASDIDAHLRDLLRGAAGFLGIAIALGAAGALGLTRRVKRQTLGLEPARLRLLFEEQAALRRVATLVAHGVSPTEVFGAVATEVADLLGADTTCLLRYERGASARVIAATCRRGAPIAVGSTGAPEHRAVAIAVLDGRRAARFDGTEGPPAPAGQLGTCSVVGAPVIVEGDVWGVVVAGWIERLGAPPDAEQQMAEFTELVATAIAIANSRTELAASRARVVAADDAARRGIERDLHDGAQQRLVSLGLELRAAEAAVPAGLTELEAQLGRASNTLAEAVTALQEVSRGIHPAVLSRGGLGPALRALARRSSVPVEVEVEVGGDQRLPDQVEVAVYYVVSEAITNATKHADASGVHVEVDVVRSVVRVAVRDDGIGGADAGRGSGLTGLRDRVEALGGSLKVVSPPGEGTSLLATLPVDPARG